MKFVSTFLFLLACQVIVCATGNAQTPAYGPQYAVGPKDTLPAEATAPATIKINVGDNWQTKINAAPVGAWFRIATGVHRNVSISAKTGQKFYGEKGAIADGGNSTQYFLKMSGANGVLLKNLTIRYYATPNQMCTVESNPGLMIEDCDISYSQAMAARAIKWIKGCRFHDNRQGCIAISSQTGTLVSDCEFYNTNRSLWYSGGNRGSFSAGYSGPIKLWASKQVTVQYCFSHDNEGPGFWDDGGCDGIAYVRCLARNNSGPGFFHEVGLTATVHDCSVETSTLNNPQWPHDGILSTNGTMIAYNNVITGQRDGIRLRQDSRTDVFSSTKNCDVHHNTISQCERFTDLEQLGGANSLTANNRWHDNKYSKPIGGTTNFLWGLSYKTWSQWRAIPQDANSTYTP